MHERFERMLQALELERDQEETYFRELSKSKSFKERIEAGILWYPVSIDKMHYSIAEKVELELSPASINASVARNNFKEGASAVFFINDEEKREYKGVISFIRKHRVRIILNDDHFVKDNIKGINKCGIELIFDDRPYRVMTATLEKLASVKTPHLIELRDGITLRKLDQRQHSEVQQATGNGLLNSAQKAAIRGAIQTELLSIIHGPPGTGKTTTLVALVESLAQIEKKILVTAPSNNAVDLLAKRISDKGIPVVRIGNVTRIGDSIAHLCLDEKVRMHKDWQHIKQVKIEADAAKKEAARYKRKFGPQQKRDRHAFRKEARELNKWARELENRLVDRILSEATVVCTTLIGCANATISQWEFNTVIIDEGSQALEAESWVAMMKGRRTIIAGDHQQLPPTVKSSEALALGLNETVIDRMSNVLDASFLLDTQYRMNHQILSFSNKHFYEGKLVSADFVAKRSLPNDDEIITFIDTSGCGFEEEKVAQERSLANSGEYLILREHLLSIREKLSQQTTIGIISPYARQVAHIREEVGKDEWLKTLPIRVNTIDGFQGQEEDVIYISLVRSNEDGQIGFLKDYRRLNVALTRARLKLVIIGDMSTLGHDAMYMDLANHVETHGTYKSAWEYMYQG